MDVGVEQFLAIEFNAVWDTDITHGPARTGRMDRLRHRFLRADAFQRWVRTDPVCQLRVGYVAADGECFVACGN
jgi:hypothetical protein